MYSTYQMQGCVSVFVCRGKQFTPPSLPLSLLPIHSWLLAMESVVKLEVPTLPTALSLPPPEATPLSPPPSATSTLSPPPYEAMERWRSHSLQQLSGFDNEDNSFENSI